MRKRICGLVLVVSIALTGCGSGPSLTKRNGNLEAEYMAGTLLKHNKGYEGMLDYDRSVLEATPVPTPTALPKETQKAEGEQNPSTGETQDQTSVEETISTVTQLQMSQGIKIVPESYKLVSHYGTSVTVMEAEKGKKLLVQKMRLTNQNSAKKTINMMKENMSYQLEANGQVVGKPLMTILQNDLQYYKASVAPGKSVETVLVFQVDKNQDLTDAYLQVSDKKQTCKFAIH